MSKFVIPTRALSLPLCAVAALAGVQGAAQADTVVIPNANTTAPGGLQTPAPFRRGSNALGNGAGAHNQIVYNSSGFGTSPITISAFSFRPLGFGSDISITDTTIRLSTTAASETTLSPTFSSNLGTDSAVVYNGALNIDSSGTPVFDVTVNLQTPFVYDPSQGNLLLDVVIPTTATVTTDGFFGSYSLDDVNVNNDGIASVTNITDGNATTGAVATDAAITQFTFTAVPEPASLAAIGLVSMGLLARRRRAM